MRHALHPPHSDGAGRLVAAGVAFRDDLRALGSRNAQARSLLSAEELAPLSTLSDPRSLLAVARTLLLLTPIQRILRLRAICEHGAVSDLTPPPTAARSNRTWGHPFNWVGRFFPIPHHVNDRRERQLDLTPPHYHLPRLHRLREEKRALMGDAEVRDLADSWSRIFALRRARG